MNPFNLIQIMLALFIILAGTPGMASECQGTMVTRSVLLKVEQAYQATTASIEVCEVSKSQLLMFSRFVTALNNKDADLGRQFFDSSHVARDFAQLRASYAPVYQRKDQLMVETAYQVGDKVLLFFGMDTDPNYTNYFTFIQHGNSWRYASKEQQRSGLGFILAKAIEYQGPLQTYDLALTLAQGPDATLQLNGGRCVDACLNTAEGQLTAKLKLLVEEGQYQQLYGYFAPKSRKKLSQWLDSIPAEGKASVLTQYFFPKHLIYRYDFGGFSVVGYLQSDGELERFNQGLITDIKPQHLYFNKQGKVLKVANFYHETLIDDYLQSVLILPLAGSK